ncbi:MAG: ATP-binding protein [Nitrospirota bacterium]
MKLSIFSRLFAGYFLIFVLAIAMSVYVAGKFRHTEDITGSILTLNDQVSTYEKKLIDAMLAQVRYERKFTVLKDNTLYEQFVASGDDFRQYFGMLVSLSDSPLMQSSLEDIKRAYENYHAIFNREVDLLKAGRRYPQDAFLKEKENAINEIMEGLKRFRSHGENNTYEKIKKLGEAGANARRVALIMTAFYLIFGMSISILITRGITKPLNIMRKKTREIAGGDYKGNLNLVSPPEIAELAQDFNFMCNKLKEIDKLKSDFLSYMSHELRTPLTSIKEGSTLLLEGIGGEINDKQRRLLTIIRAETDRLIDIVNSLLDLSKMEAGMMTYNFAYANTADLIERVVTELEPISEAKSIRLEAHIEKGLPRVKIDNDRILQVLRNLVVNAIKFTPRDGIVKVSARPTTQGVEVSVSDTGIGIPEEDLASIFDKFRQAGKSPNQMKGTGLGLAIAKHIINAHGGEIWVKSRQGQGSTFTFALSS